MPKGKLELKNGFSYSSLIVKILVDLLAKISMALFGTANHVSKYLYQSPFMIHRAVSVGVNHRWRYDMVLRGRFVMPGKFV